MASRSDPAADEFRARELVRLFESANVLFCVAGFDGFFKHLNPYWEQALGHPIEVLLEHPWLDFVHPEDVEATTSQGDRLMQAPTDVVAFENRYRHRDGSYRWLRWNVVSHVESQRSYAVALDVTEEKRAGEALRATTEMRRSITESSPDIIMMVDADGKLMYINRTVPSLTVEEVIGTSVYDYVPPQDHAKVAECHAGVFATGKPDRYTTCYRDAPGQDIWFESHVGPVRSGEKVVALIMISRDVTEQRRSADALGRSEARLRAFLDALRDLAFEIDRDGVFLNAWTSDPDRLLVPKEDLLGKTLVDVHGPEKGPLFHRAVQRVIDTGEQETLDYTIATPEAVSAYSALLSRIDGGQETAPSVACVVRDVTDRQRAQQEREALIEELEAKNSELERYTYTVSHDLKSPLVTIAGFLGMIERSAVAGEFDRLRSDLGRIHGAVQRMRELLDELLELSRIGRFVNPSENIDLSELAREAAELVVPREAPRMAGRGAVDFRVADDLPVVWGDRMRLRQAFQNLIENALKFMGQQTEPRVEIGVRRDHGEAVYFVRDNGIGIDPRYLGRIFGLFDQLDNASPGTGIGLALVKRIVEVHKGRIWVESSGVGQGATFCLTLPEVVGEPVAEPGASSSSLP